MHFWKTTGMWLILFLFVSGCEHQITSPPEHFAVTGTLLVQTVDQTGGPLPAPVSFKVLYFNSKTENTITTADSLTLMSNEQGWIEFSRTVELAEDEYFCVISDVASESYESINFWTAYFHASDAPAKRMEVQMTVITRP